MYRVLVTGDRNYTARKRVRSALLKVAREQGGRKKVLVITGGARGADTIAAEEAVELGIHVAIVPALWDSYHRGAGPTRNAVMLSLGPSLALVFHPDLDRSKGTLDMVKRLERVAVPMRRYT